MHTWIDISQNAVIHNVHVFEQLAAPAEIGCVVKNNAYGHGMLTMAQILLYDNPHRYLFTVNTDEAVAIKQAFPDARVCTMAFVTTPFWMVAAYDIATVVYSRDVIDALHAAAYQQGKRIRVHLKVDTGMHRLGVVYKHVDWYIDYIRSCSHLYLEGVITHLADLACARQPIAHKQLHGFSDLHARYHHVVPYWHAGSSGSVCHDTACNLLRIGSGMYGIPKSQEQQQILRMHDAHLQVAMTWYARISLTKWVAHNTPIGYDGTYVTRRATRIAILPIGYGEGYPRSLSNRSFVVVRGQYAPVIALVGMNMVTIDVTHIPEVDVGDAVKLIGPGEKIHPVYLAQQSGHITLEVLSTINPKIPRKITV